MNVKVTDSVRGTHRNAPYRAGSLNAQRPMEEDDEPLEQEPGWNTEAQPDELPQEQPDELPRNPADRPREV